MGKAVPQPLFEGFGDQHHVAPFKMQQIPELPPGHNRWL